jgi:hypothetical protein
MITLEEVEHAIQRMAETDQDNARARAAVDYTKHLAKTAYAVAFIESQSKTVSGREASAQISEDYGSAMQRQRDAQYDAEILRTERKRLEITIDLYRTISSARNHGQIL